jgi:amidohydrolase
MASTDEIYITIKGKGGHAATPNSITDTVYIASNLIVNLQSIVSRKANPIIPTVLSFGKVIANGATNIIPDEVKIEGTFRTFDEEWRYKALSYIKETTENLVNTSGANAEINIINGYPVLINDIALTEKVSFLAKRYLQEDKVVILQQRTTAEDFAYFSHKYPSLMYRLGTGGIDYCSYPLHSSKFEVNPNIFSFCHGLMAYIAYELTKTYSTR